MRHHVLALSMLLLLALPGWSQQNLIENGVGRAEIVVAESAARATEVAAELLQEHLAAMTDVTLPIVQAPTGEQPLVIYVGPSAFTRELGIASKDLEHGAYRMVSGDTWLALVGRDIPFFEQRGETATELLKLATSRKTWPQLFERWYELSGTETGLPYSQLWKDYNEDLEVWPGDEHGSYSAVADFLRSLGMRWYLPEEVGKVIPRHQTIALPSVNRTAEPDFPVRFANMRKFGGYKDEALWEWWVGYHRGTDVIDATFPQHGTSAITETRTEYGLFAHPRADHPKPEDWYVLYAGERQTKGRIFQGRRSGTKQCLSSPGLLQASIDYGQALYEVLDAPMISVMPGDGYSSICQCERCEGKDSPELGYRGLLTNYAWGFTEQVAAGLYQDFPDRYVLGTAYGTYLTPPSEIEQFSPNVIVCICQHRQKFLQEPETRETFQSLRQPYLDKLQKDRHVLLMYEYYRGNRHTPHYSPRAIAQDLKALQGIGMGDMIDVQRDTYSMIKRNPNLTKLTRMSVQHLDLYVTARFLWDADQDIDAMLEEYYRLFYGPAAAEMKAFVEYGEANWMTILQSKEKIDRTLELLAAARAKVEPNSLYDQRLAPIAQYLEPLSELREQIGAPRRTDVPLLIVNERAGQPITIDGKFDDPFWQDIRIWSRGKLVDLQTGAEPAFKTTFRSGWANGSLYFAIQCQDLPDDTVNIAATEKDQLSLWEGDAIEINLEPPGHSYYQIAISPSGAVVDLDRSQSKANWLPWDSEVEVATHIGPDYWNVEIRIPAAGREQADLLPFQGVAGDMPSEAFPWYFNIGRQRKRGDQMSLTGFAPTGQAKGGFHVVESYAKLYVGRPPREKK